MVYYKSCSKPRGIVSFGWNLGGEELHNREAYAHSLSEKAAEYAAFSLYPELTTAHADGKIKTAVVTRKRLQTEGSGGTANV